MEGIGTLVDPEGFQVDPEGRGYCLVYTGRFPAGVDDRGLAAEVEVCGLELPCAAHFTPLVRRLAQWAKEAKGRSNGLADTLAEHYRLQGAFRAYRHALGMALMDARGVRFYTLDEAQQAAEEFLNQNWESIP